MHRSSLLAAAANPPVAPSSPTRAHAGRRRVPLSSLRRILETGLLAVSAVALLAAAARAEPPRYEIEFVDRDAIEAPSEALPLGGTLDPFANVLAISSDGRWVAGQVRDNRDGVMVAYRIDRDSGGVEIIDALRGAAVPQINDTGHIVTQRVVDGQSEVAFWSPETGVVAFGPSRPAFAVRALAYNRYFNNADDVLVRPIPFDFGPTGARLWNPRLGTQIPVPHGSMAVNDQGVVVGQFETATGFEAFVWDVASGAVPLARPAGQWPAAFAIDDAGRIVGEARGGDGRWYGVLWPDRGSEPVVMPCPEIPGFPGFFTECAALHLDGAGGVYGGANFDDNEPLTPLVWDGEVPHALSDLLLDPDARCGYLQVSDFGELAGGCVRLDPELGFGPDAVLELGPAILHPVFPGLTLTVTSPLPGAVVSEGMVVVEGTASDDDLIASVTVDGVAAELFSTGNPDDPAEVAFAASLLLCPGTHALVVVATDGDGNAVVERFQIHVVPGETSCDGGEPVLSCEHAVASPATLWPPNHHLQAIEIVGVATADGSEALVQVTGVWQDEPVDGTGDGDFAPDAFVGDAGEVTLRRERAGLGDGRIYEIGFEATDGSSTCTGSVTVGVPRDQGQGSTPVDSGDRYDSTSPSG